MVKYSRDWIKRYKQDQLMTIAGLRGSGKSMLAKYIINTRFIPENIDYLIYDVNDEYTEFPAKNRYVPKTDDIDEFEKITKVVWNETNKVFTIDEAEQFMSVRKPLTDHMMLITRRGRHKNIGSIAITRRIAEFSKEFFSLSDWVILFKLFSPNDIRYVAEFLGKDYAELLRSLPPYHYLVYHDGKVEEYQPDKSWWHIWKTSIQIEKWYNVPEKTIEFGNFLRKTGVLKTDKDTMHYLEYPSEYDVLEQKYRTYMYDNHNIHKYGLSYLGKQHDKHIEQIKI